MKTKKVRLFKVLLLMVLAGVMLFLASCGKEEVEPVAINEDTDKCEVCNMAVVNNQFATQIILENGKSLVFDDVGCMYKWLDENENQAIQAQFVRDYEDKEWVVVKDAVFVYNQQIKTPMAYNVISFKNQDTAEAFVNENDGSTLLQADDLGGHSWERNQEMMQNNKMMNQHAHDMN